MKIWMDNKEKIEKHNKLFYKVTFHSPSIVRLIDMSEYKIGHFNSWHTNCFLLLCFFYE